MKCKYSRETGKPWFINKPNGAKAKRCYFPNAVVCQVANGFVRYATVNDMYDPKKPVGPQLLKDAGYFLVKECRCGPKCKFFLPEDNNKEGSPVLD